jgi:hypothetical protein
VDDRSGNPWDEPEVPRGPTATPDGPDDEPGGGQTTRSKVTVVVVMSVLMLVTVVLCCAAISQFGQLLWMQTPAH